MKKNTFLLTLIIALCFLETSAQKTITIPMLGEGQSITLDGIMDAAYESSPEGELDQWNINTSQSGVEDALGDPIPGHSGVFRMVYDTDYLYIFCSIEDDDFSEIEELDFGIDIGGQRTVYSWENDPKDSNPFAFVGLTWESYQANGSVPMTHRTAEIVWIEGDPNWHYEIRWPWAEISTDDSHVSSMFTRGNFFFDIGSKNKYSGNDPDPEDDEYFQWSGNMNEFYMSSMLMGEVTFGNTTNATYNIAPSNYQIFPNPATSSLHISGLKNSSYIKMIDVTGQTIFEEITNQNSLTIDISEMKSGIYFIVLHNRSYKIVIE